MISRTSSCHIGFIYNVIQGSILLPHSIKIYILFSLIIQNKYFSTLIPDIFCRYLIQNLLAKIGRWRTPFSLVLFKILVISWLLVFHLVICSFFCVTSEVLKHFLGLSVLNSLYFRYLHSNMEDSIPSKLYKISW